MLHFISNPIKLFVTITFLMCLFYLNRKTLVDKLLCTILFVYFITELLNEILVFNHISIGLSYNVSSLIQFSFWFFIISRTFNINFYKIILPYLIPSLYLINQNIDNFNKNSFVLGSFIYMIIYLVESYKRLKLEKIEFFKSNGFFLISCPIIFFLGLSLMFAFNSKSLTSTIIFGNTKLYTFITLAVNIIYYTLINVYIYKERKLNA